MNLHVGFRSVFHPVKILAGALTDDFGGILEGWFR
jgi:hypothetical protein